jgi:hypothetical protein
MTTPHRVGGRQDEQRQKHAGPEAANNWSSRSCRHVRSLDEAFERYVREGRIQKPEDVDAALAKTGPWKTRLLLDRSVI